MLRTVLLAALGLCLLLTPAAAAREMQTVLQDDALLLHRSDAQLDATLDRVAALGVDRVRITAHWMMMAPGGTTKDRPAFDAASPQAYEGQEWTAKVDRAVRAAHARGLGVMLDLGFFAPLWATSDPAGASRGILLPDVREFAAFAAAMAARYSGGYAPAGSVGAAPQPEPGPQPARPAPNPLADLLWAGPPAQAAPPAQPTAAAALPRVDVFTIWNEPNHPGFFAPQFQDGRALSPHWYRDLVHGAYPAIKAVDPSVTVLIGATSSVGNDTGDGQSAVAPLHFLRELACVDAKLRPRTSGSCATFARVPGDGYSHHPYTLKQLPQVISRNRAHAQMGDMRRMSALLDRLAAMGRISQADRDIWLTEFGYESNAEVPSKPWSEAAQARRLAEAEFVARNVPRVRSVAQFLLADIETGPATRYASAGNPRRAPGSWQTGLWRESGQAKPAAASFALPFVAAAGRRKVTLWGRVRPGAVHLARVQARRGGGAWRTVWSGRTAADGEVFTRVRRAPATSYRLVWARADGLLVSSAVAPRRLTLRAAR